MGPGTQKENWALNESCTTPLVSTTPWLHFWAYLSRERTSLVFLSNSIYKNRIYLQSHNLPKVQVTLKMYCHTIFGMYTENYLLFVRHSSLMEHGIFLLNISCNSIYRSENGPCKLFYHLGFKRVYQDANILNIVLVSSHFLLFKQIFKCLLISVELLPRFTHIHFSLLIQH